MQCSNTPQNRKIEDANQTNRAGAGSFCHPRPVIRSAFTGLSPFTSPACLSPRADFK
jgi:hypothetical protein